MCAQDHPRGCGENATRNCLRRHCWGSPPRMRGKRSCCCCLGEFVRITPADAGKTQRRNEHIGAHRDHPRGCGENVYRVSVTLHVPGSPPRMRGKPSVQTRIGFTKGITPADAGKTAPPSPCRWCSGDHPRGCGENSRPQLLTSTAMGSPPRMRGKLCAFPCSLRQGRITPADAGKTSVLHCKLHLV